MYIIASVSPSDLVVLFVVALVFLGPKRLPEVGRQVETRHARAEEALARIHGGACWRSGSGSRGDIARNCRRIRIGIERNGWSSRVSNAGCRPEARPIAAGDEAASDLMASKTEFGEEQSQRNRRGVTLSTLPPESKGEA